MTLHRVFRSSFLILGSIIGIHGGVTIMLSVSSVLGAWCYFLLYNLNNFGPFGSQQTFIGKFNSSSVYFSELLCSGYKPFENDSNDGLTNESGFIWAFVTIFLRCILKSYYPVPVFIMVTSKKFSFCDWSSFSIVYCIALFFLFKIFRKLWGWCTVSNLAWLSLTYLLYVNWAKFAVRASCTAYLLNTAGKLLISQPDIILGQSCARHPDDTHDDLVFFKNLSYQEQCKCAMNIGVSEIKSVIL